MTPTIIKASDIKMALRAGVEDKNILKIEMLKMANEAIACFQCGNWELASLNSAIIVGFMKVFSVLDWLAVNLSGEEESNFHSTPTMKNCGYPVKFSQQFDTLKAFTLDLEINGTLTTTFPSVVWSGLKHHGLAAVSTITRPNNQLYYQIGTNVIFSVDRLVLFATMAKDLVEAAPIV